MNTDYIVNMKKHNVPLHSASEQNSAKVEKGKF